MARNVEVKARLTETQTVLARLRDIGAEDRGVIVQEDIYFDCPNGRLKLRLQRPGADELIFYQRPDRTGPRASFYLKYDLRKARALAELLDRAFGRIAGVRKERRLFLLGRTRIHIDQVEHLGAFLELEVMMREAEADGDGRREALALLETLNVGADVFVAQSYLDLALAKPR